jgi:NAD(P)-dependent dehydrogenase (short-subunit alcohol dehydrogenase family)
MMVPELSGKVAIVTGAGHGMGEAHALALARAGASVALVDICKDNPLVPLPAATKSALEMVAESIRTLGGRALPVKCDVSKASEVEAMVKRVKAEFGRIDILVNNAGVCTFAPFWEITEEQWDVTVDVNLKGTWLCAKYVVPHMIAQNWGRIVNIGSIDGRSPEPLHAHYCASKGGVHTMTLAMAREVGAFNITVNCIAPGGVMTPMFRWTGEAFGAATGGTPEDFYAYFNRTKTIMNRQVHPEDVSNVLLWLVREDSWPLTGQVFYVDGGFKGHASPWELPDKFSQGP